MVQLLRQIRHANPLELFLGFVIALMLATQIMQQWWFPGGDRFNIIHIALAGAIVTLGFMQQKPRHSAQEAEPLVGIDSPRSIQGSGRRTELVLGLLALAVIIVSTIYFYPPGINFGARIAVPTTTDFIIGSLLVLVATSLVWHAWGPAFASLGLIAIAYAFLGRYVPEPFTAPPMELYRILARLTMKSLYQGIIDQFSNFIWFIIFWALLLETSGGATCILRLAQRMARKGRSGPAVAAVISSALLGSVTGTGSTVVVTGPITIPLMKRAGYTPAQAGGILAASSTGATLSPPIMGVVPFIMADQLGVSYARIMQMVLFLCFLWYATVLVYVVAAGARMGLRQAELHDEQVKRLSDATKTADIVKSAVILGVPIGALIFLIIWGTPMFTSVLYVFLLLVGLALLLRVEKRLDVWWQGIRQAALMASSISLAAVTITLLTDVMFFTGLGIRLGDIVYQLSQGNLLVAGLMVLIFGIFLGTGLPTLPVYFVMIITFQPVFFQFGLPQAVTLFVAFYMGVLADITPPTAPGPLVASRLTGAGFWSTSVEAMKAASTAFVIPFAVLLAPEILLGAPGVPTGGAAHLTLVLSAVALGHCMLSFGLAGWMGVSLSMVTRLGLVAIFVVMFVGLYMKADMLLWAAVVASLVAGVPGLLAARRVRGIADRVKAISVG